MNLFLEASIVGFVTAIVGFIISTAFMFFGTKNFSFQNYPFWPQVVLSYFITGFVLHIGFEWVGLNQKFCCQKDRYIC